VKQITNCNQIEFTSFVNLCNGDKLKITARWLNNYDDGYPFDILMVEADENGDQQPIMLIIEDIPKVTEAINKLITEAKLILEVKDHDTTAAGSDKSPGLL